MSSNRGRIIALRRKAIKHVTACIKATFKINVKSLVPQFWKSMGMLKAGKENGSGS